MLVHTEKLDELVRPLACLPCNSTGLHVRSTDTKEYAVQHYLTCLMCIIEVSSMYQRMIIRLTSHTLINHLAVLALREGSSWDKIQQKEEGNSTSTGTRKLSAEEGHLYSAGAWLYWCIIEITTRIKCVVSAIILVFVHFMIPAFIHIYFIIFC